MMTGGESFFRGSMRFKPGEGFTDLEGGSAAVSAALNREVNGCDGY